MKMMWLGMLVRQNRLCFHIEVTLWFRWFSLSFAARIPISRKLTLGWRWKAMCLVWCVKVNLLYIEMTTSFWWQTLSPHAYHHRVSECVCARVLSQRYFTQASNFCAFPSSRFFEFQFSLSHFRFFPLSLVFPEPSLSKCHKSVLATVFSSFHMHCHPEHYTLTSTLVLGMWSIAHIFAFELLEPFIALEDKVNGWEIGSLYSGIRGILVNFSVCVYTGSVLPVSLSSSHLRLFLPATAVAATFFALTSPRPVVLLMVRALFFSFYSLTQFWKLYMKQFAEIYLVYLAFSRAPSIAHPTTPE